MHKSILICVAAFVCMAAGTARAQTAPTTEFQQGYADRQAWEEWFTTTTGDYRTGTSWWAGQRSVPHPASCDTLGGAATQGCYAAKCKIASNIDPTAKEVYRLDFTA